MPLKVNLLSQRVAEALGIENMKVPFIYSNHIKAFCRNVVPDSKPIYVVVQPLPDKPINECFNIVPEHILAHGGEQQFGWSIWHWPKVFVEAEFHSVWKCPDGTMVDITPKRISVDRILFLPDPHRHYEGRQVDNIRKPISNDPLIKQFLALAEERYRETNKGDLANQHGRVIVSARVGEIDHEMRKIGFFLAQKFGSPLASH
jgi:hypothetical protein